MKHSIYIVLLATIFCVSCDTGDNNLQKTVVLSDNDTNNDLPAYSEYGYNSFGAYIDREVFSWSEEKVPAKLIVYKNNTSFILNGSKQAAGHSYNYTGKEMTISFVLVNKKVEYNELISFNNTTIDLTDTSYLVVFNVDNILDTVKVLSGKLSFNKVKKLIVDQEPLGYIMAGNFDFKAILKGNPISISKGRFDVGISIDNYFNY